MPLYVRLLRPSRPAGRPTAGDPVQAGMPTIDNCPILTRLKAFVVDQGVTATLEHTFRDRTGNPVDLTSVLADDTGSASASSSAPAGAVFLRVKEFLGTDPSPGRNPVWEMRGSSVDAAAGVVRATLDAGVVAQSGIYELNWAVVTADGSPVAVDRGLLSVERSLFPQDLDDARKAAGPPGLQEIRMRLMDSSPNENLLLDDVEFKDEQILLAMNEPVRCWNEMPPPIERYTTRTFPYRGAWLSGVLAQLHLTAATHYRRNFLDHAAGGVSVRDKAKEKEYMAEGQRLWQEYKDWCQGKKVQHNLRRFAGYVGSTYGARYGWGW